MLLRFKFSNHASYRDSQELSWVASSLRHQSRPTIPLRGSDYGVLPACAIYGANASGKSSVIDALMFFVPAALASFHIWDPINPIPRNTFHGSLGDRARESQYQLDFVFNGERFQYGLVVNDQIVLEEWLNAYPTARKQSWFHRKHGSPMEFSRALKGQNRLIEKLTRPNATFLSVAAVHGHKQLSELHSWMGRKFKLGLRKQGFSTQNLLKLDEIERNSQVLGLIQAADLGIVGLKLKSVFGAESATIEGSSISKVVSLVHQIEGKSVDFPEELESEGTRVFVDRLPAIFDALKTGGVFVVDEIDRSLHPKLSLELLKLFLSPATNPNAAQILFTTHDTSLLGSGALRRDEIWFTEKQQDGSSTLLPMSDIAPRKNENLELGYLQGRYGGTPNLSEYQFKNALLEQLSNGNV